MSYDCATVALHKRNIKWAYSDCNCGFWCRCASLCILRCSVGWSQHSFPTCDSSKYRHTQSSNNYGARLLTWPLNPQSINLFFVATCRTLNNCSEFTHWKKEIFAKYVGIPKYLANLLIRLENTFLWLRKHI